MPGTAALNRGGSAQLSSVSCTSPGNCSAGGGYANASGFQVFVVSQVNGTWHTAIEVPGTAALNQGGEAVRELREETGLAVTPADLYPVAYTTGHADLGWASGLFRDDFFVHRVTSHDVDPVGLNEFERQDYGGHHWWTQAELTATRETIYPAGLAALVADLVAGRLPATPIALPWHH